MLGRSLGREPLTLEPVERYGLKLMSVGFLIGEDQALSMPAQLLHGALRQLLANVEWGELDVLVIDMPPGTADLQTAAARPRGSRRRADRRRPAGRGSPRRPQGARHALERGRARPRRRREHGRPDLPALRRDRRGLPSGTQGAVALGGGRHPPRLAAARSGGRPCAATKASRSSSPSPPEPSRPRTARSPARSPTHSSRLTSGGGRSRRSARAAARRRGADVRSRSRRSTRPAARSPRAPCSPARVRSARRGTRGRSLAAPPGRAALSDGRPPRSSASTAACSSVAPGSPRRRGGRSREASSSDSVRTRSPSPGSINPAVTKRGRTVWTRSVSSPVAREISPDVVAPSATAAKTRSRLVVREEPCERGGGHDHEDTHEPDRGPGYDDPLTAVAEQPLHRALGLTDGEFDRIRELLERDPNHFELAVFSLLWSEHCGYKHSAPLLKRLPSRRARACSRARARTPA